MSEQRWKIDADGEVTNDIIWIGIATYDPNKVSPDSKDPGDLDDAVDAYWLPKIAAALNAAEKRDAEPVRLSAEMLGEEDRAHLWNLRRLAMRYETPMTGKLDPPCVVWADRLLGSADKGGE